MIREAIEYIVGLGKAQLNNVNGQEWSDKRLHLVEAPTPKQLEVHTLSGLVGYIKSEFDGNEAIIVHVVSPTEVSVNSSLNTDKNRNHFVVANAMIPTINFGRWYDSEGFNILLQSGFVRNEDRDIMLKVVGNIKEENVNSIGDNGISQSVTAKVGVATVGKWR